VLSTLSGFSGSIELTALRAWSQTAILLLVKIEPVAPVQAAQHEKPVRREV